MNKKHLNGNISRMCLTICAAFALALGSCMPDGDVKGSSGGGTEEEAKPTPSGVKTIALYSNLAGSNLSGLYFNDNGFLTSDNGWMLSEVGYVPGIGNVDYIPITNWANQITPVVDLGFVGYHPREGFVSFLVASLGYDENRLPFAVGLMYYPGFTGGETAVELFKDQLEFPAEGGTQTVSLKGPKYSIYQLAFSDDWVQAQSKGSVYSFIDDEIEVTVEPNTTGETRSGFVKVVTDRNMTTTLAIKQAAN